MEVNSFQTLLIDVTFYLFKMWYLLFWENTKNRIYSAPAVKELMIFIL